MGEVWSSPFLSPFDSQLDSHRTRNPHFVVLFRHGLAYFVVTRTSIADWLLRFALSDDRTVNRNEDRENEGWLAKVVALWCRWG